MFPLVGDSHGTGCNQAAYRSEAGCSYRNRKSSTGTSRVLARPLKASLFMVTAIFPKFGDPALAGQPAKPVRQPTVFGTIKLVAEVIVPLLVEKATIVPAGMALPLRSTTVTMNVRGTPP